MARYHLHQVGRTGVQSADLTRVATGITSADELNGPGLLSADMPALDVRAAGLRCWVSELQLWRDDALVKWAVLTRFRNGRAALNLQCPGLWRYFHARRVGRANRVDWLLNGDFEDDAVGTTPPSHWTPVGITNHVVNSHFVSGGKALELIQAGAGVDSFVYQDFAPLAGVYYTFSGWIHIYGDHAFVGPAFENRGLFAELIYPGNVVHDTMNVAITADNRPGVTYRLEGGLAVPADAPGGTVIRVRLMAPGAWMMWDRIEATVMESLSFQMADVATVLNGLVAHAQDPAFGKDSLAITASAGTTGKLTNRTYQFADHENVGEIIEGLAKEGLIDFDVVCSASTRSFQAWSPHKGSLRADHPVVLMAKGGNVTLDGFGDDDDGESAATSVTALGPGDGPSREEANATDTSILGVILEDVVNAPAGAWPGDLPGLAATSLAPRRRSSKALTLPLEPGYGHDLATGDLVPVYADYGATQVDENMRIVRKQTDVDTDSVTLTLNWQ